MKSVPLNLPAMHREGEIKRPFEVRLEEENGFLHRRASILLAVRRVEVLEGLHASILIGPRVDVEALEKHLAPKVGTEAALFPAKLLDQVVGNVSKLPLETWAIYTNVDAFSLAHAAKQQAIGVALLAEKDTQEVDTLVVELEQAKLTTANCMMPIGLFSLNLRKPRLRLKAWREKISH
uniref:Uncharacterized protein n=1 Tax=Cannabis sativa TaxID=3483 RepID=A0A803PZJ0_CANSA